jgi:hypothetical protein
MNQRQRSPGKVALQRMVSLPGVGLGVVVLTVSGSLSGCGQLRQAAVEALLRQGHAAAIDCLERERASANGDELRCNDWNYVKAHDLRGDQPAGPGDR